MSERTVTLDIDKVKAAAATSPEAHKALRVLCPEAFEPERVRIDDTTWGTLLGVRIYGNLAGRGAWLDTGFTWTIETDSEGELVLTARRKESA